MLSTFAKFLLVSTSLSPLLGAVAVNQISNGETWKQWGAWLTVALLLVILCRWLLSYAQKNAQKQIFDIKEFERNEKEVVAFLIAYLLPFLSTEKMSFTGDWLTGAYILVIIFMVIAHAGAFHFNPVLGFLGYHFYTVKNSDGVSYLLISKEELRRPGQEIQAVRLAQDIYLNTGGTNA